MKNILIILAGIAALSPAIADAKANSCPSQNFAAFFKAYRNNVLIQKKFTANPLKYTNHYDSGFAEKPAAKDLMAAEIDFPIMIDDKALAEQGVSFSSKKQTSRWYKVITISQGTDAYANEFDFKKLNGCWQLEEWTDFSG